MFNTEVMFILCNLRFKSLPTRKLSVYYKKKKSKLFYTKNMYLNNCYCLSKNLYKIKLKFKFNGLVICNLYFYLCLLFSVYVITMLKMLTFNYLLTTIKK